MHNPPHPGEVLQGLYLEPLGLTVKEAASALGVSRTALSQIIHGHARLSVEMGVRLAKAFRTTPELWLRLQLARDLWEARRQRKALRVKPLLKKRARAG
jgi:addiction module HigA family antidote